MRVVLLGLPGSGKSTQSAMIANHYSIPSVSAGSLLREAVAKGTEIGRCVQEYLRRGELAPNYLVDQLVFGRLSETDAASGFVLDGFPRTLQQAESLDEFIRQSGKHLTAVIHLDVPDTVITTRLGARRVCPGCGAIINVLYNRPRPGEICYACHTPLRYVGEGVIECEACKTPFTLRQDDQPEVVRRRLQVQRRTITQVLAHYQSRGLLTVIDGSRQPKRVFEDVLAVLSGKQRQVGGAT